jgi:hypothetical protein
MPVSNRLDSLLQRALSNNILSQKELGRIKKEVEKDGVTPEEVNHIVDTLAGALASDGIELDTAGRRKRLNNFLAGLDSKQPTGLQADTTPAGGKDFISALRIRGGGVEGDPTPLTATDLPTTTGDGKKVGVSDDGQVAIDGTRVSLDLASPGPDQVAASLGLARGGNLAGLSDAAKGALAENLTKNLVATFPIPGDGDKNAFKRVAASGGQAAALRQIADQLGGESIDKLIASYKDAPNDMVKSQLLDALGKAPASDAQKADIAKLDKPEHQDALLKAWDDMAGANPKVGYSGAKGPIQDVALAGLTFCKKPASLENFEKGLEAMKDLNRGDYSQPWDAEEAGHLGNILENYCLKHGGLGYVFGTFSGDVPKEMAKITNKRLTAELMPGLVNDDPTLLGVPLTRAQAAEIKDKVLPGLKDKSAAEDFARALNSAAQLDSSAAPGWGAPPTADKVLSPAEADLVTRVAAPFIRDMGGSETGMIDTRKLRSAVEDQVKGIRDELQPRLKSLEGTPPKWGDIEVDGDTAKLLKQLAGENVRSKMSVTNIDLGLKAIAAKSGGKVTGDAAKVFDAVVNEYKSNWPGLQTFDFNKLERIARFKVEGKDVPLCTINGQSVGLAKFYGAVGAEVAGKVDKTQLRHEWMADRYGFRARQSVEILDVFAEQMVRGEGPVAALKKKFPGAEVNVQVTGQDFAHTEFLFEVKQNGRSTLYNQGSDGKISEYRGRTDPKLFDAKMKDDGSFDVTIPDKINTRRYPVQQTYSIGDTVDFEFLDSQATEVRTEGEKFDTKYKILEGEITGFTADGKYELKVTMPDGKEETKTLEWSKLRRANHPHYFSESGSYLRDVTINLTNDPDLKTFLDNAQPIIDKHLPKGETASMTAAELAERQKNCIAELMDYTAKGMKYPKKESSNADDQQYWKLDDLYRFKLGELTKIKRGVCRHQCIAHHLLLQRAGIDSRLASGAANTGSGNYRGLHLWVEVTTADGARFLSDQTWKDEAIPLWDGAYDSDARRTEIYNRTSDFSGNIAS